MDVRILPKAKERLLDIWDYTAEKWDVEQADKYVSGLVEAAKSIPKRRMTWRSVKEKRFRGVFFLRHEHHYIFFREFSEFIGVISILHENMNLPDRLKEDE